ELIIKQQIFSILLHKAQLLILLLILLQSSESKQPSFIHSFIQSVYLLPLTGQTEVAPRVVFHWTHLTKGDLRAYSYYDKQDQLTYQEQIFRDRTSLFKDQISTGNTSLKLTGVKVQDEGRYECFINTSHGTKASFINLQVYDVNIQQVENRITCSSEGIYPQPELTWSTTPPSNTNLLNSTTVHSLILSHSDTDLLYSCTISTPTNRRRAAWRKLSDEDFDHQSGKWTYLLVSVYLSTNKKSPDVKL
uniref:Ig-like domain-containing protein n=1 Tax=Amphiprion percula TaxID=161767 RepID=A0A3P8S892_AMPPE